LSGFIQHYLQLPKLNLAEINKKPESYSGNPWYRQKDPLFSGLDAKYCHYPGDGS